MLTVHTFYTPSHKLLFDRYLYPSAIKNGFDVRGYAHNDQLCDMAKFAQHGWRSTQLKKVEYYLNIFTRHSDQQVVVCSDADVQIIKPCSTELIKFLKNDDISFQENLDGRICSGFFVARCNDKVIDFFQKVVTSLANEIAKSSKGGGEQYEIWKLIESGNHDASVGKLPKNEIWNPRCKYTDVNELRVPSSIMVHHANWNAGLESKIDQLNYVQRVLNEM